MMGEPSDVAALLAETPLAGLPAGHGPGGTIVVGDLPASDLLQAWRTAHRLIPVTGRWPVMAAGAFGGRLEMKPEPDPAAPAAAQLAQLDRAARTLDPWPHLGPWDNDEQITAEDVPFFASGLACQVDLAEQASRQETPLMTVRALGHWAYQRVLSDPALTAPVLAGAGPVLSPGPQHMPARVSLLLLPTPLPWLAPHWISFHGALGQTWEMAAVLWQWHQLCGAQLVAGWDLTLQLLVQRPPAPGDQAWTVAGQILDLASHLDLHRWELAVALAEASAWQLYSRP